MGKTLTPALESAIGERLTRPCWLAYVGFSVPLRLASYKDTSWDGHTWTMGDIAVRSFSPQKLTLERGNKNNQISAYVLNEGINDKEIRLYKAYYNESGELAGVKGIFEGYGSGADLSGVITVSIFAEASSKYSYFSPRFRICEANGFHYLLQPGTTITWGGSTVVFEE